MKIFFLLLVFSGAAFSLDIEQCFSLLNGDDGNSCSCYDLKFQLDSMRSDLCRAGMKSGAIADSQLSASSTWGSSTGSIKAHSAKNARLDKPRGNGNGGWSAKRNLAGEFIEVDLKTVARVTGLIIQGRAGYDQWVTKFSVQYSQDGKNYHNVNYNGKTKIFYGNVDRHSYVTKYFPEVLYARFVRIIAKEWHKHISLRFELLTC